MSTPGQLTIPVVSRIVKCRGVRREAEDALPPSSRGPAGSSTLSVLMSSAEYEVAADLLVNKAELYAWSDLDSNAAVPPALPGVYAWFFTAPPEAVPTSGCVKRDGAYLLYVGISPGRTLSTQNLRTRILFHFRGNAEGSTLRLTLGCLLEARLGTVLRRVGSGRRRTFGLQEAALTNWIQQHARVTWIVNETPHRLETHLVSTLALPLNLDQNKSHSFHRSLSELRRRARKRANAEPILSDFRFRG